MPGPPFFFSRNFFSKDVTMWNKMLYSALIMMLVACSGCGKHYAVAQLEGSISVDGKAVPEGFIAIAPLASGQGSGVSGEIVGGHYTVSNVPVGKVRVYLTAVKSTGKTLQFGNTSVPEKISLIPEQYHEGIELEVRGEKMLHNFSLVSHH
jgi:hypothetical protein